MRWNMTLWENFLNKRCVCISFVHNRKEWDYEFTKQIDNFKNYISTDTAYFNIQYRKLFNNVCIISSDVFAYFADGYA